MNKRNQFYNQQKKVRPLFKVFQKMNVTNFNKWKVYIIQTESGKLYTGITNNIEKRFAAHKNHHKGARFFYFTKPEKIVFQESHLNRSEASKREIAIKKMSRKDKLALIGDIKAQLDLKKSFI